MATLTFRVCCVRDENFLHSGDKAGSQRVLDFSDAQWDVWLEAGRPTPPPGTGTLQTMDPAWN